MLRQNGVNNHWTNMYDESGGKNLSFWRSETNSNKVPYVVLTVSRETEPVIFGELHSSGSAKSYTLQMDNRCVELLMMCGIK